MEFRALGPLEVVDADGVEIPLPAAKERALLQLLLVSPNRVVSIDRLVDELWGEEPPASAVATLRSYASRLRKALGDASRIVSRAPGYLVRVDDGEYDVERFDRLVADAGLGGPEADPMRTRDSYRAALALWRGPALADIAETPTGRGEASRLEEARLAATEDRIAADLACGDHRQVIAEIQAVCEAYPLRERLWSLRMLALYRGERQAEALRVFQEFRRAVGDLGLEPSPSLVRLEQAIVERDPSLVSAAPASAEPVIAGRRGYAFTEADAQAQLARELGPSWPDMLGRHFELIDTAFVGAGGVVLAHSGGGVRAVFPSLEDAVEGCVAAQQSLGAEPWANGRVRMGAHEGEAVRVGGDVVGIVVHELAGIIEAANGGQILTVVEVSSPSARSAPLGSYRLRGFDRPLPVFEIVAEGMTARGAPPRAPTALAGRLPAWGTSFVGRDEDNRRLSELAGVVPLVTITGPGGCGKTRLAVELARSCAEAFGNDVWFVDLAAVQDAEYTALAVAARLGLRTLTPDARADVVSQLASRRCLLVLDNCEHVIDEAAKLADALLTHAPDVRIIATSRESLAVGAEVVWQLGPLALPTDQHSAVQALASPALRLFVDRIRAKHPGFELGAEDLPSASDLVRLLDGLPLAIEVAAAGAGHDGIGAVRALGQQLRDMKGRRTSVDRHETIDAALDWGYHLLTELERRAFRRLAVFRGGFTDELAEAVCGDAEPVQRLVDKSLVAADGSRHRLYEMVAGYGEDRLRDAGELEDTRDRHMQAVVRFAISHRGVDPANIEEIAEEYDNIRAALARSVELPSPDDALRLCAAVLPYWQVRGQWSEGREWLRRCLALEGGDDAARTSCLTGSSTLKARSRDPAGALADAEQSLRMDVGPELRANALATLAAALCVTGEFAEAAPLFAASRDLAREIGNSGLEAEALRGMGSCAHLTGDLAGAVALAEEGLLVARSIDATNLIGPLINNLGAALQAAGELEQAAAILEESLRLRRASGDIEGEAFSLANLGENAARRGDHRRAASYARGAYELFARLGEHNGAMAAGNLAAALIELGDSIGALRILGALDATGLTFGPAADAEYDDAARRARASSDPAAADAAWALGRAERIGAAVRAADRRA